MAIGNVIQLPTESCLPLGTMFLAAEDCRLYNVFVNEAGLDLY